MTNPTPNDEIPYHEINVPEGIAPIKPEEFIGTPAGEALHNASVTQKEVKSDYHRRLEEQEEKRAKFLARIKREHEEMKKNPDVIKLKIRNLKEQVDECEEALHYAKQDYEAFLHNADITGKATAAKVIMERIEREIYDAKKEISELEGLL
jgi:hypothetical protein